MNFIATTPSASMDDTIRCEYLKDKWERGMISDIQKIMTYEQTLSDIELANGLINLLIFFVLICFLIY